MALLTTSRARSRGDFNVSFFSELPQRELPQLSVESRTLGSRIGLVSVICGIASLRLRAEGQLHGGGLISSTSVWLGLKNTGRRWASWAYRSTSAGLGVRSSTGWDGVSRHL